MATFAGEWLFVLATLVGLAVGGGSLVVPFRRQLPYGFLAAPLCGLLVLAFGGSFAYNDLGVPLVPGLIGTAVVGTLATALAVHRANFRPCWRSVCFGAAVAALLALAVVWANAWTTIALGGPSIQFSHGTDHANYAHIADWIAAHPPWDRPRVDPRATYELMPALLIQASDPRFGTYVTLALVAQLRGLPSFFAYDSACALIQTATILGVASVFARSPLTLVLLVVGLCTSHWYDHGRTGFFGKLIGYPAAITAAGLLLHARRPLRPATLASLLLLTAGATVVYWSGALLILVVVGGAFLAARVVLRGRAAFRRPREIGREVWPHAVALGLMIVLLLVVRAYVARALPRDIAPEVAALSRFSPLNPGRGFEGRLPPWDVVTYTVADLISIAPSTLPDQFVQAALWICLVLWAVLAVVAWYWRDARAVALTAGPMALATAFSLYTTTDAQWVRLQLPGTYYPLALGAAALLIDRTPVGGLRALSGRTVSDVFLVRALTALLVLGIALHIPRWPDTLHRYAGPGLPSWLQFSQAEMDELAAAIGTEPALVDIPVQPHPPIALHVELGRRGLELQWGEDAWRWATTGRLIQPPPARPATLVIQLTPVPAAEDAVVVYANRVYRLIRAP